MRLVVVGCSGSYPGPDSACSAYLVQAEAEGRTWSVLMDLGNGALGPLQRVIDPARIDAVALSHLHADHVADIVVLNVLLRYGPVRRDEALPVHGPQGTHARLAQLSGDDPATGFDGQFEIREWEPGRAVQVGPLRLEPVPVRHPVPAFGLRVTGPSDLEPGRAVTLTYSGDTDACEGLDELATGTDLLLVEAAFVEGRDDGVTGVHLTGRRAGEAAARGGAARVVLTHIPPWNDRDAAAAEAAAVYSGPLEVARVGATYVL
jgi:ribonuclease BN (tRNA processing enzyme)